jgi:hypothetical protein
MQGHTPACLVGETGKPGTVPSPKLVIFILFAFFVIRETILRDSLTFIMLSNKTVLHFEDLIIWYFRPFFTSLIINSELEQAGRHNK